MLQKTQSKFILPQRIEGNIFKIIYLIRDYYLEYIKNTYNSTDKMKNNPTEKMAIGFQ